VLLLAVAVLGFGQTAVTPRDVGVLLFDNNTGATAHRLSIIFDKGPVTLATSDIIVFGGGVATLVACSNNFAWIDVIVAPGGTLQIALTGLPAGAKVVTAYWFK
jgi:hypothetical protein